MFQSLFCVSVLVSGFQDNDSARGAERQIKSAHVSNKYIKFTIHYPQPCVITALRPITLTVENIGKRPVYYTYPFIHGMFEIELLDSAGKTVPRTRYGQSLPGASRSSLLGHEMNLAPGRKFEMAFDLQRAFDLTMTGSYSLSVRNRDGFAAEIADDAITICDLHLKNVVLQIQDQQ